MRVSVGKKKEMEALTAIYTRIQTLFDWISEANRQNEDLGHFNEGFLKFLNDTLVCYNNEETRASLHLGPMGSKHTDLVDRAIAKLVKRGKENVLSKGFQTCRNTGNGTMGGFAVEMWFPNTLVNDLKRGVWEELTNVIGDDLMIHLLCESSLFVKYEQGNYLQMTGLPISSKSFLFKRKRVEDGEFSKKKRRTLQPSMPNHRISPVAKSYEIDCPLYRSDHDIPWTWMLYGRPVYNQDKGNIIASLPLTHTLAVASIDLLIKEVFPFEHIQIHPILPTINTYKISPKTKIKRIARLNLVKNLLKIMVFRYRKCNLQALIDHYCPIIEKQHLNLESVSLLNSHTPVGRMLGFLRSVLNRIIPVALFGTRRNFDMFLNHLKKLVSVRRYERLSLGNFVQSIRLCEIFWLYPQNTSHRVPHDHTKASHLFHELILWIINGLVIPLIKSNFYVTESTSHKNLILYFRHKSWTRLNASLYESLTKSIYKEIPSESLQISSLGVSSMRLLPKAIGVRPIVNLSRKSKSGERNRGISVNQALKPLFEVIRLEASKNDTSKGFSVSSKKQIHVSLKNFKQSLTKKFPEGLPKIYFCKVDIKACFDSIDQFRLLELVESVLKDCEYIISGYSSVQFDMGKIRRKFSKTAQRDERYLQFSDFAVQVLAKEMYDSIIVDGVIQTFEERDSLLNLLKEHIGNNIIKAGKKYFKQVVGIPQGSVLSTLLCSLYYGKFEMDELASIISGSDSLLMRLVDDFLLLTTDLGTALQFASFIHRDQPDIGFHVNASKSLVNFDVEISGLPLKRVPPTVPFLNHLGMAFFPWCGLLIEMNRLDVFIDHSRIQETDFRNSLTVDITKNPGQNLLSKVFVCLKNRMHSIHIDPVLNRLESVLIYVYQSFVVCAHRLAAYAKDAFNSQTLNQTYILSIIKESINYKYSLLKSRFKSLGYKDSVIYKEEVTFLGTHAFQSILKTKQPKYNWIVNQLLALKNEAKVKSSLKRFIRSFSSKSNVLTVVAANPVDN